MFYGQIATTVDTLVPKIVNGDVLRILYEEACKLFVWKDRLNFEVKQNRVALGRTKTIKWDQV